MNAAYLIFNDKFSDNLGDGLLSECLDYALKSKLGDDAVQTIDIDGKETYPAPPAKSSTASINQKLRQCLPASVKDALNLRRLERRLEKQIRKASSAPKAFVIGGGHLLTATTSYFPLRILVLARIAHKMQAKIFIHAVGMSDPQTWNKRAEKFLIKALRQYQNPAFVSMRDHAGIHHWQNTFPDLIPAQLCRDPGLLSATVYGNKKHLAGQTQAIGIGVINKDVIRKIGGQANMSQDPLDFYGRLSQRLIERGHKPVFFTNGDWKDDALVRQLEHSMSGVFPDIRKQAEFLPRPSSPAALAAHIKTFDAVIAYRMHANILAYALGIPTVGLGWDKKLENFFEYTNRMECFVPGRDISIPSIESALDHALNNPIDPKVQIDIVQETWAGVESLSARLQTA